MVDQGLRQHVRAGDGELEGLAREGAGAAAGQRQVERAAADRAVDHARRPGAEAHAALGAIGDQLLEGRGRAHARQRPHEVLDHAVGLGVVDVEARELAVAHHVDAGLLLGVQHHARRVDHRLLAGIGGEPIGNRIGPDHGRQDARHGFLRKYLDGYLEQSRARVHSCRPAARRAR